MSKVSSEPLAGKRIVVTRALEQSKLLCRELEARGAEIRMLPLVRFASPEDHVPLDAALRDFAQFDWLFLTSQNAVLALANRCRALKVPFPWTYASIQTAAVGRATAAAAKQAGLRVDHVAKTQMGVALAEELRGRLVGRRILLPRSDHARPDLPQALRHHGASVTEIVAYRTLRPAEADKELIRETVQGDADAILFFSPSAVHHLAESIGTERFLALQTHVTCAAIGPLTAAALREAGVEHLVVSHEASVSGILEALAEHWSQGARAGVDQE